ncbi:hypothetical protein PJL18_02720 [Paenarthrobacter nicotinovorans]|nr:hypothetical protein [Paenarthrobacter nicotinovorans]
MQEVVGAVNGVDHPGPSAGPGHRGTLFTKDAVLRPATAQLLQDVGLGCVVGCGDDVRDGRLAFALQPAHPHEQRQLPRFPDQGAGQLVVIK